MLSEELFYDIALSQIKGIGSVSARKLISFFGSSKAVLETKASHLVKVSGIGSEMAKHFSATDAAYRLAESELKFIEKEGIKVYTYNSPDYPTRLKNTYDSPIVLYAKGNLNLDAEKTVAIVGTRAATAYGKELCQQIVEDLKPHQALMVSGLALGIDGAAHKAAVDKGLSTVGVLGNGLTSIYPSTHRELAKRMLDNGGLLTEFIGNEPPNRENFPSRNRIIAGLSDVVIVVESDETGGSIITAEYANNYNKDVFAIPGNIGSKYSKGTNKLIKINKAHLMESVADIEYIMNWTVDTQKKKKSQQALFVELNPEEQSVYNLLSEKGKMDIDSMHIELKMNGSKLSSLLLNLELQNIVRTLPGKTYELA